MIKSSIRARTYRAIYRLLDRVSPVQFDCGTICGASCCDADSERGMGLFLLPGEDKIHDKKDEWLTWETLDTENYDFPDSWQGKVHFAICGGPEHCERALRPIQCRTFPLEPYFNDEGELALRFSEAELPYCCPLIEDEAELEAGFVRATYTVWKHLIRDPLIYDFVAGNSEPGE